jgi:hypothetical protein
MAAALMSVTTGSQGWKEMRKLAGNQFYAGTVLVAGSGKQVAAEALANRENTAHWIDAAIAELASYKAQLLAGDAEQLAASVDRGLEAGKSWLNAAVSGQWEIDGIPPTPPVGMGIRELFFGRLGKPRERQGEKGKK